MGHLGSNFVKALIRKGNKVQVWNRTATKAQALAADGAMPFENAADAVKGANRIHLTLRDDATVDEILALITPSIEPGAIIIDHTTTSAEGALQRTTGLKEKGITYFHAPVFMGPQNALESTGSMLVSGDQELIKLLEPELSQMTGKVINFGTVINRAAGMKLLGNLFLIAMTAGVGDTLGLAKALDIPTENISALFESWNPAAMVPARLKKMTSGTFNEPTWELNMARKDARLMMEGAEKGNVQLAAIPAIATEMDKWIAKGHGQDDWTIIGSH